MPGTKQVISIEHVKPLELVQASINAKDDKLKVYFIKITGLRFLIGKS